MYSPETRDRLFRGISALLEGAEFFPIRFCISLRPEWYTELRVSLGASAPNESRAVYILRPLSEAQAGAAISKPLANVDAAIAQDASERLLEIYSAKRGPTPLIRSCLASPCGPHGISRRGMRSWPTAS